MSKKPAIFPRPKVHKFLQRIRDCWTMDQAIAIIREVADTMPPECDGKNLCWRKALNRLADGLAAGKPAFGIFRKGNGKLPFFTFSTVPIYTCPGRGACEKFCYSLKAWQYPSALCRQLQNWLLMRFQPSLIAKAFMKLPQDREFRLYVDGDFASMQEVGFWFRLLLARPDLDTYGYSKSLQLLVDWHDQGLAFPPNYALNLSSGGKHERGSQLFERARLLPCTREEYLAVEIKGKYARGAARYKDPEYHKEVRQQILAITGKKGVSCGGDCGNCGSTKHWCGDLALRIPVGIGIH